MRYIILMLAVVLLGSCMSSKHLTRLAGEEEKQGNYLDAFNLYYEAFEKKVDNKSAKKGAQRTAQEIYETYATEAVEAYNAGDYSTAYEYSGKADRFKDKCAELGLEIEVPKDWNESTLGIEDAYKRNLYMEAAKALETKSYGDTRAKMNMLEAIDPYYTGLDLLKKSVKVAPVYDQGMQYYAESNYTEAYTHLQEVEDAYPGYRDTRTYLQLLLSQHSLTIGVLPFRNFSNVINAEAVLQAKIMNQLIAEKNPLIAVLNGETLLKQLDSNTVDSTDHVMEITRNLGGNTILKGELVSIQIVEKPEQKSQRTAYLKETVIRVNPWNGSRYSEDQYKEAYYYDITVDKTISLLFKYEVVSATTGEVIYGTSINRSVIHQVKYATYDGEVNSLYPSVSGYYASELGKWREKFYASADVKPNDELVLILLDQVAKEVVEGVMNNSVK